MWPFSKPKPGVCSFCKQGGGLTDPLIKMVEDAAYDGFLYWFYHEKCWKEVLKNPYAYRNGVVDMAIEISDSLRERDEKIKRAAEFSEQRPNYRTRYE